MVALGNYIYFRIKEPFEKGAIIFEPSVFIVSAFQNDKIKLPFLQNSFSVKSKDSNILDDRYLMVYLKKMHKTIINRTNDPNKIQDVIKNLEIDIPSIGFQKFFVKRYDSIIQEHQKIRKQCDQDENDKMNMLFGDHDEMINVNKTAYKKRKGEDSEQLTKTEEISIKTTKTNVGSLPFGTLNLPPLQQTVARVPSLMIMPNLFPCPFPLSLK